MDGVRYEMSQLLFADDALLITNSEEKLVNTFGLIHKKKTSEWKE